MADDFKKPEEHRADVLKGSSYKNMMNILKKPHDNDKNIVDVSTYDGPVEPEYNTDYSYKDIINTVNGSGSDPLTNVEIEKTIPPLVIRKNSPEISIKGSVYGNAQVTDGQTNKPQTNSLKPDRTLDSRDSSLDQNYSVGVFPSVKAQVGSDNDINAHTTIFGGIRAIQKTGVEEGGNNTNTIYKESLKGVQVGGSISKKTNNDYQLGISGNVTGVNTKEPGSYEQNNLIFRTDGSLEKDKNKFFGFGEWNKSKTTYPNSEPDYSRSSIYGGGYERDLGKNSSAGINCYYNPATREKNCTFNLYKGF